jgi:hypothetical protein
MQHMFFWIFLLLLDAAPVTYVGPSIMLSANYIFTLKKLQFKIDPATFTGTGELKSVYWLV